MYSKLIMGIISLSFLGCSTLDTHQDYSFIEQVGGIAVIGQSDDPDFLEIRVNVSGLETIAVKPTTLNSALAVKSVKSEIDGSKINIYVVTTLVSDNNPNFTASKVNIGGANKGLNQVFYLNKDGSVVKLKDVDIQ